MKLILSERELEIIKQKEYKRGWDESSLNHKKKDWDTYLESVIKDPKCLQQIVTPRICPQCGKIGGHGSFEVCMGHTIA